MQNLIPLPNPPILQENHVHIYQFALYPELHEPSGSANFTNFTNYTNYNLLLNINTLYGKN